VPLLRQEPIPAWRSLALVEHHGPLMQEADDPNSPAIRSGNPPTYGAIRAREWVMSNTTTERESYHNRTRDPYELQNTFWSLTPLTRQSLHAALAALQTCQGAQACWESARFPSTSAPK
jgi:N-acetylglucosamine-6-sulfatase